MMYVHIANVIKETFVAKLSASLCAGQWAFIPGEDCDTYLRRTSDQFAALQAASDAVDLNGDLVGLLVNWQVADGHAWYRVSASRPLTLEHIPFGDAYGVSPILIRGLNKKDVIEIAKRDRILA